MLVAQEIDMEWSACYQVHMDVLRQEHPAEALRRIGSAGAGASAASSAPAEPASPSAGGGLTPLEQLRGVAGNGACADCGRGDPDWASLNLGVLLCIECSGVHRRLGVHVSKARPTRFCPEGGRPLMAKALCWADTDTGK